MNTSTKAMMAAILAAVLAIVPLALADGSYAADTGEETEYDTDLGVFWSMTIGFSYSGEGARSVTWDFGDGSEPVTAFSEIHTFESKGVYYVTQTAHNTNGDSVAVYKVTVLGYPYVEFDTQGGSDIARIDMTSGGINATAATEPEDVPTKDGFTFSGWYTEPECTNLYDWSSLVDEPVTLYAGWTENAKATITFDVDEGYPPVDPVQWTVGTQYTIPGYDGTKGGFTFGGWLYNGTTYLEGQTITVEGDMTLTAVWNALDTYTVTFNTDGGSVVSPQTVYSGSKATEPAEAPSKQHYTFAGWFDSEGQPFDFDQTITSNTTVYAHWTPVNYTVSFDVNGGEGSFPAQTVAYGSKATNPGSPTRDSYRFNGWYLDGRPYDFDTPVSGNITLEADWSYIQPPVTRYTVTFDPANGESTFTSTVVSGGRLSEPSDPEREGYTFAGWFTSSGEEYDFTDPVRGNFTLTAHWIPDVVYTVTFDTAGGSAISNITVPQGESIELPDCTRIGYILTGWTVDGTTYQPGESYTPTGDVTITASWEAKSYNVSYHDGENATIRDTMVKHGARAAEITAPEKEGFEFVAWTLNGEPYDFSLPVTSDIVLVAQYEPLPPTVTVDKEIPEDAVMSGTIPDDVRDVDEIVLPDVSKPGESFVGWDTDGDGTADSQPGDSVEYIDGQTSLTPVFEDIEDDKQHQITIEGAPEIPFDNWYVEEDRPIVLPDIPREDEVLVGYDTDSDGIADVMPGQEYAPTGDVTLTPIFEEKPQHSVSSDIEEDAVTSEPVPDTVYEGSEVVLPDASRPGQVLEGWDTDGDGTADKQPGETVVADDDVTLKPVWRPLEDDEVQHEVTVDAGDGESPFDSWYPVDGQPVTLPEPSIDGDREFQGWVDQDGNRYQAGDVVYPSEDMTLTAQWSDAPEEGTEWWVYAAIVIAVILVIVAVVLILHYRVGVI